MGQFRYVTNRTLKNKSGEVKGRIKVLVREGSDTAEVDYACPECGFSEHKEQEWQRPFIVKCSRRFNQDTEAERRNKEGEEGRQGLIV
jgi:hypothetical protein